MTGNAGTFVFESEKDTMSIPEYDRTNDKPFEDQNKCCGWVFVCLFVLMHWQRELEILGRGGKIATRYSIYMAIAGNSLIL